MSFSKALLGLAAVTVLTSLASAQQQTLSCTAQPVDNPALRDNGVTERVGDLKIICTGGTSTANGAQVPKFNLQIFTSPAVNITSRGLGGDLSEALLLIDEPASTTQLLCGSTNAPASALNGAGVCDITGTGSGAGVYNGTPSATPGVGRPNAFVARQIGTTSLVWNGIPFDPPGTSGARIMRITNVRVNASQLNNVRGGATSVNIIISTTSSGIGNSIQVPIGNPAPTVGIAQTPMDFGASNASFLQCESQNNPAVPANFPTTGSALSVTFTERFGSALRRRSAANATDTSVVPAPAESNILDSAQLFETESGFYKFSSANWDLKATGFSFSGISTDNLGLASSGTRLLARFKNLPSGATVYYANHASLIQVSASAATATGDINATLADANGGGVYSSLGSSSFSAVTAVSGSGAAVWEVIRTNTNVTETVRVPLAISYAANTSNQLPTLGSATADGQLAPLSTTATASATAQIPRFVEDSANNGKPLFTINACRSNLLFPFLVNGSGYETGLAIVNTTKDPFGTQSQTGSCTVVFYGKSGTSDVCLTQTSKSIAGGQFISWTLGGGGDVAATPNFTGYAIAQCNFQYGHGFAFITDTRVEKIAQGYLALVMDDPIGAARSKSKSESLNN